MSHLSRNRLKEYGVAGVGILIATAGRLLLDPVLGTRFPFATLFFAVLLSAWYGGFGPALAATVAGAVVSMRFLLPPRDSFTVTGVDSQGGLALYLAVSLGIALLGGAMRLARLRAEALAEEANRQHEETLTTLSSIGDGVITTDAKGCVVLLNPVAEALTGWTTTAAAGRPLEDVFRIVNEQTRQTIDNPAMRALREGVVVGLANHTVLIARDGTERPIDDSSAPIKDASGGMAGAVLVFRDITARRQAERELQESEERFRLMANNSPVLIWMSGLDQRCVFFNRPWLEFTGRTFEAEYGDGWADGIHPDDRARCLAVYQEAFAARRTFQREFRLRHRDGDYRWLLDSGVPRLAYDDTFAGFIGSCIDITERKKVEEELREQREWLKVTLSSIGDAVIVTDVEGRVRFLNPVARSLIGWTQSEAEGQPLEAVFCVMDETTRTPVESPVSQAMREGRIVGMTNHTLLIARDGTQRTIDDSAAPIQNDSGDIAGVVLVFRDVTEQRKADATRRRLAAIVESSDDAIIGTTLDGAITSWNHGAERLYGYAAADVIGKSIEFLTPSDRLGEISAILARVRQGEEIEHYVADRRRSDGSIVNVSVNVSAIRDDAGRIVGTSAIVRDVTQMMRTEQSTRFLADASATLAGLVDYESTLQKVAQMAVPFFADWCMIDMLQPDGSLRRLSAAHVDPARVQLAEEMHRRFPPDPESSRGVWNILRTGESEINIDIPASGALERIPHPELRRILEKQGLTSYMGVPLTARGKVLGVLTFITAESGRRYDAHDLAVAEDLAHRAAVAIENAQLYQARQESDRRKDEFLAMLAHELRNPLAPIRNALQILKMPGLDQATASEAREMAERQVHHLTRLVDDLLDVSRIMRGKIELRRERVDLATIIARAVETARPVIDAEQHELVVSVPPSQVWLSADLIRLAQVIANLLTNAAKYTKVSGKIWLTAQCENGEVTISIRDTGIGIPPELLPHIFEMFMQVAPADSRSQGGLGIGLTLVRNLVEMHGGTVEARSDGLGRGSEFIVRIPALSGESAEPITVDQGDGLQPAGPSTKKRVLVVDDNADAASSLALLLRLLGHQVHVANDGPEALQAVAADCPDLVLLDIGMPGMDGYEVARRLRALPGTERTLIVALTGWGQSQDRQRSKDAGFDHHLTKPVEPAQLQAILTHRAHVDA